MALQCIDDEPGLAEGAAALVVACLAARPQVTVALATGRTPRGLYRRLVQRHEAGSLALDAARFFNLDEFVGLRPQDPRSYSAYLWKHLLASLHVPPAQVRLLQGNAGDLAAECRVSPLWRQREGSISPYWAWGPMAISPSTNLGTTGMPQPMW
jgi:6-phosphogluconolactonase/glucosamine-6-phosphate isomerase/deaminase